MRRCTGKCGLITICAIQLLATIERQVFDFLGYMWLPIIANFLQMVAVIFGFFGAYQHRVRYLAVYTVWSVLWLGWNAFVLCFYLEAGTLRRGDELLSLYTGAASFWEWSGPGCVPVFATNASLPEDPYRQPRPERVDGCWLSVQHVEAIHAGLQLGLAVIGLILALCLIVARRREDDSSGVKPRPLSPAFHIEYRPHRLEERPASPLEPPSAAGPGPPEPPGALGPAPMTPRKIKRRAMSRGSQRSSGRSARSGRSRSSQRARRPANPVTQLLDSSSSEPPELRGHSNAGYLPPHEPPRPPSARSSYSNYHGQRRVGVGVDGPSAGPSAVASDYGTTGTLSGAGYGRRAAGQVPRVGAYADYGRAGPPPYEAVPSLTETSM